MSYLMAFRESVSAVKIDKIAKNESQPEFGVNFVNSGNFDKASSGQDVSCQQRKAALIAAGVPASWAYVVPDIFAKSTPELLSSERWARVVSDCEMLTSGQTLQSSWLSKLAAMGWQLGDVFGCHPTHPIERLDYAGIALLLNGTDVVAVTNQAMTIQLRPGVTQTIRRCATPSGQIYLWELCS